MPPAVNADRAPDVSLRGQITWQTLISGVLVAIIMGLSYPYMVLKLGFGPNVSVVAAFFGFLFLKLLDLILRGRHYDRWQNNLTEAAGTSAAQTAFMCVLLGAFDILRHNTQGAFAIELPPLTSFLWLTCAGTLGVLLAVPLRRHFIVDEKLPYPDGLAAAETITVLDPPRAAEPSIRRAALRAFWAVMIGTVVSGLLMALRDDAKLASVIPEGFAPEWTLIGGVVLANLGVGASYSLLAIGSGMIIGLRINVSMMLGGLLAWVLGPYLLIKYGVALHREPVVTEGVTRYVATFTDAPTRTEVLFWVMWPATGMLVAGGMTALLLRWRLLVETFRSLRHATIDGSEFPLKFVIPGALLSAIALCFIQWHLLGMPVWITVLAILLSIPLMLVGLRVLGETNWGPISALSNMMQGLFAAIAPGHVLANMVASGTTGTIATSSEAIMQDYKAGSIVGTKPRLLTIMQLMGVPIGAGAVAIIYPVLTEQYGIIDKIDAAGNVIAPKLASPISNKWAGFAQILQEGVSALPTSALYALIIGSVLGVVLTVLESNKRIKKWIPSATGIGIGIVVGFSVICTMFIGSVIGAVWQRVHKRSAEIYMIPLGSGLIAGEALVAVLAAIYLFFAA